MYCYTAVRFIKTFHRTEEYCFPFLNECAVGWEGLQHLFRLPVNGLKWDAENCMKLCGVRELILQCMCCCECSKTCKYTVLVLIQYMYTISGFFYITGSFWWQILMRTSNAKNVSVKYSRSALNLSIKRAQTCNTRLWTAISEKIEWP